MSDQLFRKGSWCGGTCSKFVLPLPIACAEDSKRTVIIKRGIVNHTGIREGVAYVDCGTSPSHTI